MQAHKLITSICELIPLWEQLTEHYPQVTDYNCKNSGILSVCIEQLLRKDHIFYGEASNGGSNVGRMSDIYTSLNKNAILNIFCAYLDQMLSKGIYCLFNNLFVLGSLHLRFSLLYVKVIINSVITKKLIYQLVLYWKCNLLRNQKINLKS